MALNTNLELVLPAKTFPGLCTVIYFETAMRAYDIAVNIKLSSRILKIYHLITYY